MQQVIRVLIADDHPLVLRGIRETLSASTRIDVVAEVGRSDEAQQMCRKLVPDVLLMDLQMPGATAPDTIRFVQKYCATTRVVILSAYDDDAYVRAMVALGVAGYVLKDEASEVILGAIHVVMQGGTWFSRRVLERLTGWNPHASTNAIAYPNFTPRERQILDLMGRGRGNVQIAMELSLKEQSVRHHASAIYGKLGVNSRAEAVVWAKEHGFGSP